MKTFWKRFKKYIITGFVVLALIWIFFPKAKKIEYVTEKVSKGTVEQIVSVTGTVDADPKITMHFQKPGKIEKVHVKVGDTVHQQDILASLELKTLQIQANQAAAGVELAKANLNVRLVGPSPEEIDVAQKSIDSATVAYNASLTALEQIKKSTDENNKKAQLQVSNAEISLANAQIQYDNSLASQVTTTDTSNQSLTNAYENAKPIISTALATLRTSLPLADSILGIDQSAQNSTLKNNLGGLNAQAKIDAEDAYPVAKTSMRNLENLYTAVSVSWQTTDIETLLHNALSSLQDMKMLIHNVFTLLVNTISSSAYSLDTYKTSITTQETSLVSSITNIQNALQSITNAKLGISSSSISTSSSVEGIKANLDTAKNNLETAKRTLEQTKVESEKMISAAQSDIDLKLVSISSAKAAYAVKVAKPRSVDIAALQAQVKQAESIYELALQNLKDAQIIAPIDGVITEVNGDVGENVTGAENMIVMIAPKLKIKANVSETDIMKVHVGDGISMTLDAFSSDQILKGEVIDVAPAETVVQGVIYYQITALVNTENPNIKAGMTVNLDILANRKEGVLTVSPQSIQYKDNKPFVRTLMNGIPQDVNIQIGLEGNKLVEMVSGLKEGDNIILYEK